MLHFLAMKFLQKNIPYILLAIVLLVMVWSGVNPLERATWFAEIIPGLTALIVFTILHVKYGFSNLTCFLASIGFITQSIGAHYTFAQVPINWLTDFAGFTRNNFDRIGHFAAGFMAIMIAEIIQKTKYITRRSAIYLFSLFSVVTFATTYELFEWMYSIIAKDINHSGSFLGSQGDIWDAQKDILMDTLGAIFVLFLYFKRQKQKN